MFFICCETTFYKNLVSTQKFILATYFINFFKVKNSKKRQKLLKYVTLELTTSMRAS